VTVVGMSGTATEYSCVLALTHLYLSKISVIPRV
jgi:hypothetical protein